jgi:hypothetical protein
MLVAPQSVCHVVSIGRIRISEGHIAWGQSHSRQLCQQLHNLVGVVHIELRLAGALTYNTRKHLGGRHQQWVQQQGQQQQQLACQYLLLKQEGR